MRLRLRNADVGTTARRPIRWSSSWRGPPIRPRPPY